MTNREEIERRRTFAIISHPDAGKTTLTEKLLLYGGAINQAGSVKGKQSAKHAVSDWMDIEKQRGISVTSSVLQFNYAGKCVNILDTPGHQDFSEDTYRTLMAADSAVMVIDAAKGVEAQTIKLFKVCTLRHIPIFTFINKMDREARDPFELMENIEEILGIKTYPMNWPIGCGKEFKGVFDRNTRKVLAFSSDGRANGVKKVDETEAELGDPALDELLTPYLHQQLVDEIELLDGAAEEFDLDKVLRGELSPVFFGSALTNFGVEPFLKECRGREKSLFMLVKTSNPSSGELQNRDMEGKPLYARMAEMVAKWGEGLDTPCGYNQVGAVVGATYPEEQKIIRELLPKSYFLVPGYGAQGATAKDIANAFNDDGLGAIVNSSRGIMCAWKKTGNNGEDYKEAARAEAIRMRDDIVAAIK